jgi:hypothetical protein
MCERTITATGNKVFVFNGTSSNLTTTLAVNPTGGMSEAIVVKTNSLAAAQRLISARSATSGDNRLTVNITTTGQLDVLVIKDMSNYIGRASAAAAIAINTPYVVSFIYDGGTTNGSIKTYINGTQVDASDTGTGTYTVPAAGATLSIGASVGTGYTNGSLSEPIFVQGTYWSDAEHQAVVAKLMAQFGI